MLLVWEHHFVMPPSYAAVATSEDKVNEIEEDFAIDGHHALRASMRHRLVIASVAATLLLSAALLHATGKRSDDSGLDAVAITSAATPQDFVSNCLKPSSGPVLSGYDVVCGTTRSVRSNTLLYRTKKGAS